MQNTINMKKFGQKSRGVILTLLVILMLTTGLVSAAGEDATVSVTRLTNTYIGIKIEFASDISGDFAGVINGRHFNCITIGSRTLYCLGRLAYWVGAATLHIYETPGGDVILSRIISAPPIPGETDETPPEPESEECPPGECNL